jgi:Fur family transcriptional regulator, ferric uptake regulator
MANKSHAAANDAAEALIRKTGDRLTSARVQILKILLNSGRALSHNEIEAKLGRNSSIDRVTVYRVLEWLTESGLAHRLTDAERVWRFNITSSKGGNHPHFTCTCCDATFCLENAGPPKAPRMPNGFRTQSVEMTVRGLCNECSQAGHNSASHGRARRRSRG